MTLTNRITKKLRYLNKKRLITKYDGEISFDIENAIIISGMPRGGSTWFSELLRTIPNSSLIWEPLHLEFYPRFKELNFKWRQHIAEDDKDEVIKETFDRMMKGEHLTQGIMQRTEITELIKADFLIIKFCRANRLLPWLTNNFKFKKVIHLLRHPCAVISSQLKFGAWEDIGTTFTKEELKPDGFIENYYPILKNICSIEEKLAAIWCLDNIIPLTHSNKKWVTISYENLLKTPSTELKKIGLNLPEETIHKINQPSSTTKKDSPINDNSIDEQLSYWKKSLSPDQIVSILTILEKFNITVYNDDIYPLEKYER